MGEVVLHWLPLGAGGWFVRFNGRVYEACSASLARRPRRDIFHAALEVTVDSVRHTIELCPEQHGDHGRVAGGAVGLRSLGRFKLFRYEARCWRDGAIPDIEHAVGGPVLLSDDRQVAARVVALVPAIPTPTWGRDELHAGEMWNSNSVIAWLLESAGIDAEAVELPRNGRAPGWDAGVLVARR